MNPIEAEELRMLYQVSTTDVAFTKRQQILATNYLLLIQAGLAAVSQTLAAQDALTALTSSILTMLLLVVTAFAWSWLRNLQAGLAKFRSRLVNCRSQFGPAFHEAFGPARVPEYTTPDQSREILVGLVGAGFCGLIIAIALVWLPVWNAA